MNLKKLLKDYHLSLTSQRIKILSVLYTSGYAMTEKEIEVQMQGACNKTTIYRNLSSLVEKKILHRIISEDAIRYKLIAGNTGKYTEHLHFLCNKCHNVYCMDGIPVQDYTLPDGFKILENQFLILGICKECRYEMD